MHRWASVSAITSLVLCMLMCKALLINTQNFIHVQSHKFSQLSSTLNHKMVLSIAHHFHSQYIALQGIAVQSIYVSGYMTTVHTNHIYIHIKSNFNACTSGGPSGEGEIKRKPHFILMFQRQAELWFEIGEEENEVMVMADACLALCCKCLEMSLSFESLLRTLSKLISSPLKVYIYSSLLVVEAPIRVGPS